MIKGNTQLLDRYRILKKIGTGGMSNVYLAIDNSLGKKWAIKEVASESAFNEACIMKEIDHPSLPRIVDILVSDKAFYIIMDYIEGVSLDKLIKKRETIPIDTVISWSIEIARALDYLHSHSPPIYYRDMKPSNIIIQRSGHIKLIDFGISTTNDNKSNIPIGTKGYAPPEQYNKLSKTDQRTDIYSLGVTIKVMLKGQRIPHKLSKIVKRCTKDDPKGRYQSSKALIKALEKLRRDLEKKRKKRTKNKIKFIILSLSIIIICVLFDARIQEKNKVKVKEENEVVLVNNSLNADAVLKLIEGYKEDGEFTNKEEKQLLETMDEAKDSISIEDRRILAKDIGLLYWYYYSLDRKNAHIPSAYGIEESIKWLEQSGVENDNEAKNLEIIAKFNKNLIIELNNNLSEYEQYFYALEEIIKDYGDEGVRRDRAAALVDYSIEAYTKEFAKAGIPKDRVLALYCSYNNLEDKGLDIETETVNEIIERAYDL